MLRAGRFKHRLLDDTFLKDQSLTAHRLLTPLIKSWRTKKLSDFDIVLCYLLILLSLRRPHDFLSGRSPLRATIPPNKSCKSGEWFFKNFADVFGAPELKSLSTFNQTLSLAELFVSYNFRSIPLSVNRTMANWINGAYQLALTTEIPTASEVLSLQAKGRRCISMLIEPEQFGSLIEEGRDVLGFIVHDLIHADHFFLDPEKAQGQILFSQKLMVLYSHSQLQEWMQKDPLFAKEFTYLMSDMNSVPLHLIKTLKAICLGFYKRQNALEHSVPLTPAQEQEFQSLFRWLLHPWMLSDSNLQLFDKINTLAFCRETDGQRVHSILMQKTAAPLNYCAFPEFTY